MSLQPLSRPSFCIIAPTAYLDQYAIQSNTHLALAHLVETDSKYADFYLQMRERGHYVMMDCSAFELGESYEPSKLVSLGKRINANAVVLPDYPGQQSRKTIDAANQYIPLFKDNDFDTFYVPQSRKGELNEWLDAYQWGALNPNVTIVGMSILGIPTSLPHIPTAYARVVITQLLIEKGIFNFNKHHHYLGLNAAPNVELPSLLKMNALTTCDSSNPVWCGVNGIKYNTLATDFMYPSKKYLRHVDFDQTMVPQHLQDVIQHNIDITLDIFVNPDKYL